MATVAEVVTQALKKSGIIGDGQSAEGGDTADAILDLGDMLSQWNVKRWLVWHLLEFTFVSNGTTNGYTVGPGGNFNMTPRPNRLEYCFVRQLVPSGLNVDYSLEVIEAREEYSRISLKKLTSFPKYAYLETASPIATLYIYPWPPAATFEIHIGVKDVWPLVLTMPTSFSNYPPYTIPAMKFNLARRLRQAYGKGLRPDPELNLLAKDGLETMRNAQVQIPELVMPKMLITGTRYNIFSDQTY